MIFSLLIGTAISLSAKAEPVKTAPAPIKLQLASEDDGHIIFDLPIAYNSRVSMWIKYFQGNGRGVFNTWLERSFRHVPKIQRILAREGLPKDLAYVSMIESGFSSRAVSTASAVGPWQFIAETGERFGLRKSWWLDERRDLEKSTKAAARYFRFLHREFGSWYLAAAGYNAGEARIRRLVNKLGTKNFWVIAQKGDLADETENYVPKLIAAMLIAKAPALYGFRELDPEIEPKTETFYVPGGTQLDTIADHVGIKRTFLRELNPELIRGLVPPTVSGHRIKIPKGTRDQISGLIRKNYISSAD